MTPRVVLDTNVLVSGLEAAVTASAGYIVSGDADLLDLGSFDGISIVMAAQFVTAVLNRDSGEL